MKLSILRLRFSGDFTVLCDDGIVLTPKSKKAVGLLALLATSDTGARQRRWIEDKLWSDRGPNQARGSLRTTLVDIRRAFGDFADVLGADRSTVWLNTDAIETDLDDLSPDREFLEGLDVGDEEFNAWLARQRLLRSNDNSPELKPKAQTKKLSIQCGDPWLSNTVTPVKAQVVNTQIGKIVSDFIASSKCTIKGMQADLVIRTAIEESADGATILVQVIDPVRDEIVHSDHCFTTDVDQFLRDPEQLGRFCWNLADLTLERIPEMDESQDPLSERSAFVQSALRHVLSFEQDQMHKSLNVLADASDRLNSGLYLALRAWALTSMIMEGFQAEDTQTLSEIKMLLRKAQELAPKEGMVAAVCANVQSILLEDFNGAIALARRALRENSNNIFALQAMSVSRAAAGQWDLAYEHSRSGQAISSLSKFGAMCNLHHSLLCISMQRSGEAIQSSLRATDLAPTYRAPRRQLLALFAAGNQPVQTQNALGAMQSVEPGFDLDRYLFDRSYPSNTLRKSGFLEKAIVGLQEK